MKHKVTTIPELLDESYLLVPELITSIKSGIQNINKESWVYFIPFLLSYNLHPKRSLYYADIFDMTIIFQHLKSNSHERIDFVIPPFRLNSQSLKSLDIIIQLVKDQLDQDSIRILWVDKADKNCLSEYFGNRLAIEKEEHEYLYDVKSVINMDGPDFKDLRKSVNKVEKQFPEFKKMEYEDLDEAMELLKNWRKVQGRKNDFLLDWGYTKKALMIFKEFSNEDLYAWCIKIDNKMVGFAMAGPITKDVVNFFIIKTDIDISGLSLYLRWRVLRELKEFSVVNDASDLGIPGLKQHKMKLRPFDYNTVFTVSIKS